MSEETKTKFCRDCRFYDGSRDCRHPKLSGSEPFNLVTGKKIVAWMYAREMRRSDGDCGHEATLFEPRLSIIDRLKAWWKS